MIALKRANSCPVYNRHQTDIETDPSNSIKGNIYTVSAMAGVLIGSLTPITKTFGIMTGCGGG